MMNFLERIVAYKHKEVEEQKSLIPVSELEKSIFLQKSPLSLRDSLLREDLFGIIGEFKRKSPSKGIMNRNSSPATVCSDYILAGCSAVSVLTDSISFGGSGEDLTSVRKNTGFPILRKDFIIDEYQIIEARALGADAILLIAELHNADKMEQLHRFAGSVDLEVLVEIHDEKNITIIPYDARIVGINSRNLGSLKVDPDNHLQLIDQLPRDVVKVAESGIRSVTDYLNLCKRGFDAFLIGELFMNTPDPGLSCNSFFSQLKNLRVPVPESDKIQKHE
jgi:indole-3-glycerol phosphate synthase